MMRFLLIVLCCSCSSYATETELKHCFEHCWGVDPHTSAFLCKYFRRNHALISEFINKSAKQNIQFPLDQSLWELSHDDGVIQATRFHLVVFENPYVRILAGNAAPGEREPFHSHEWASLLVIFEPSTYKIEYKNGHEDLLQLEPGVYELPPEEMYACTNLGTQRESCLRFEIKNISAITGK